MWKLSLIERNGFSTIFVLDPRATEGCSYELSSSRSCVDVVRVGADLSSAGRWADERKRFAASDPVGHPDLQGIWANSTTTPMERPADLEGREFLTEEERAERNPGSGISTENPSVIMPTSAYNDF